MDIVDKVLWDSSYDTRQEAADEIERLRQQNAALAAALRRIANDDGNLDVWTFAEDTLAEAIGGK